MTGWADTWMMSTKAKHPNCMLKWMAWMLHARGPDAGRRVLRRGAGQPQGVPVPRRGYGAYQLPGLLRPVRRQRPELLQLDRVLEDAAGGLRRRPRPDVHRLLGLDPEVDGDQGLSRRSATRIRRGAARRSARPLRPVAMTARRAPQRRRGACGGASARAPTGIRSLQARAAAHRRRSGWFGARLLRLARRAVRRGVLVPRPATSAIVSASSASTTSRQLLTRPGLPGHHAAHHRLWRRW